MEDERKKIEVKEIELKLKQQIEKLEQEKEQLKLQAKQQAELLQIQQEKERIKNEEHERELNYMEELSNSSVSSVSVTKERPNIKTETRNNDVTAGNPTTYAGNYDFNFNEQLIKILAQQNEISSSIAKNQLKQMLPNKTISIFDGADITKYKTFIMNFQHSIEQNCDSDRDKLSFLLQYTAGRAHKIVSSCTHYNPTLAYSKAIELLTKEFGNEFKVSSAYLQKLENWPPIKNEDPVALENLSVFLIECRNYFDNMSIRNQLQSPHEIKNSVEIAL